MDKGLKHDLQHEPKEVKITLDHEPKEVKIMLDKERTLRLDMNAYAELDLYFAEKDKSFFEVENDFFKARPYAIRAFLWAALLHEDKSLTMEQVGRMISPKNQVYVLEKLYSLVIDDTPEHKSKEEKGKNAKK